MQGTVLQYDKETHKGYISGHDGNRYQFAKIDWTKGEPKEGVTVDFDPDDKVAKEIIVVKAKSDKKPKLPVWTLGISILCVIGMAIILEDDYVTTDEFGSMAFWSGTAILCGIISIAKKQERRKMTYIGMAIAVLMLIAAYGGSA